MTRPVFAEDVVEAVRRHMNVDHAEDSMVICRHALGGQDNLTAVTVTGMDADGIDFMATVDGREVPVRILWSHRLSERPEIRAEVVRLYHEACAALGIAPGAGAEPDRRH